MILMVGMIMFSFLGYGGGLGFTGEQGFFETSSHTDAFEEETTGF